MHIETLVVGPLQVNCYIVVNEATGDAIIIDPGGDADTIIATIRAKGWNPVRIVNTHCHFDHVLGVQALKDAFGIPFWVPRGEEPLVARAPEIAREWLGVDVGLAPTVDVRREYRAVRFARGGLQYADAQYSPRDSAIAR